MQVKAKLNNFGMSARKIRPIADLIRGQKVKEAKGQLLSWNRRVSQPLIKLIDSAIANSINNFGLDKNNLFLEKIIVNEGTVLKRWEPRSHGQAYPILKRSCHIEVILNEIVKGQNRSEVKKKEVKTISYEEIKKVMKEADKVLKKTKGGVEKVGAKKVGEDKSTFLGMKKKPGFITRLFRRKSV